MPRFFYKAKKGPKEYITGTIEAQNQVQAITLLEQSKLFPVNISQANIKDTTEEIKKVSPKEIALFTRQFANLIESGVSIIEALNILCQQSTDKRLKNIIKGVISNIKDGYTLSDAFGEYPNTFGQFYCSVVKAGEMAGSLETAFNRLAEFKEAQEQIKSDVLAALTYPALIFIVGIATIYILLTFVVPRMANIFAELNQALPFPTQLLIDISKKMLPLAGILLLLLITTIFLIKRPKKTQDEIYLNTIKFNIPVLGKIMQKFELANFVRTLSLLLESGITMLTALTAIENTTRNVIIKKEISQIISEIKDGASLSKAIKKIKHFPPYVVSMINVGEESGSIEKSLKHIATSYEKDLSRTIRTLTSLLEPIMIIGMGLIVAFIAVALLLPVFQMNILIK